MENKFEIERKYIIEKPSVKLLEEKSNQIIKITQTYLGKNEKGFNCRIREVIENQNIDYILTEKKNINGIKRIENEFNISKDDYDKAFKNRLKNHIIIQKTRYCISKWGFTYEIDVFPFWNKIAVMEVELESENINPPIPEYISLIKEVTGDKSLTNYSLSQRIPSEDVLINMK